jgi:hypothetical protein
MGWATFWAIFLTNASGHPGCIVAGEVENEMQNAHLASDTCIHLDIKDNSDVASKVQKLKRKSSLA